MRRGVVIQNKLGLHARASAKFVGEASRHACYIGIKRDDIEVNGKSIMGIMMLAAAKGTTVELIADGDGAEQALDALQALIDDKFGEGE